VIASAGEARVKRVTTIEERVMTIEERVATIEGA
jgi:hypothetical protein